MKNKEQTFENFRNAIESIEIDGNSIAQEIAIILIIFIIDNFTGPSINDKDILIFNIINVQQSIINRNSISIF